MTATERDFSVSRNRILQFLLSTKCFKGNLIVLTNRMIPVKYERFLLLLCWCLTHMNSRSGRL